MIYDNSSMSEFKAGSTAEHQSYQLNIFGEAAFCKVNLFAEIFSLRQYQKITMGPA